jgi:hypothetical protein
MATTSCLGLGFKVEGAAGRLLAVLTLGAAGALGFPVVERRRQRLGANERSGYPPSD